jgi:hypothetical protein
MTSTTRSRPLSPWLNGALALLTLLAGCEAAPEVVETHAWDGFELNAAVIDIRSVEGCELPTAASLADQLSAVASEAEDEVMVSVSEPVLLTNEKLRWAVSTHFAGLWTLNLDGDAKASLLLGMPPAVPETTDDYREVWKDLHQAGVCGVSVASWQFPAAKVQTVAWIIDSTTFHESITDTTIVSEAPCLGNRRTDRRCGSARWTGESLGAGLEVGVATSFLVQFGLCGDYIEPDWGDEEPDPTKAWELSCTEANPTIESTVPFGRFECGEAEYMANPRCCGARVECELVIGLGGFEYSISRTPMAVTCPEKPWDAPPEDDGCEAEW